jgi:hypothetical protein
MAGRRMSRPVSLTVMAPCSLLNINDERRKHWAVVRRLTKAWRTAAREAALEAGLGALPYPCHVTAYVHRSHIRGRWDAANYYPTAKAIVDGIVDAGLLPDDANRYVTGPDMRPGDGWSQAGVVLILEPITLEGFTLDAPEPVVIDPAQLELQELWK